MPTKFVRYVAVLAVIISVIGNSGVARANTVSAAGVVTNCTGQGLADAMNSGSGLITFACGAAPVTITITQDGGFNAVGGASYIIDGGNLITLSGGNINRLFNVASSASLTLTNIVLTNGYAGGSSGAYPTLGGAILNNGGILVLDNVIIRNSQSIYAGGAIENAYGTTLLNDSVIENNQSDYGGGIDSIGLLTLVNSIVRNNHALGHHGGGLDLGDTVTIDNSQIYSNTAAQHGGGIYNIGTATLTNVALSGNAAIGGGGIFNSLSTATLTNVTLNGNSASFGGGIYNTGTATLTNATLSGNSALYGFGGGIFNFGAVTLNNSTLSGNSASSNGGGGIYHDSSDAGKTITLKNTIVANSPSGGNCFKYPSSVTSFTSSGFNLSSDNSCASYFNQVSDQNSQPAQLGPLQNNGGFTLTHLPLPPIVFNVGPIDNGSCPASTDQRGVSRPQGVACDIGAVEYRTGDELSKLFLPLVLR